MNNQVPNLSQYPLALFQQGYQPGVYYDMYRAQGVPWDNMFINIPLLNRWGTQLGDILRTGQIQGNTSTGFSG